jgi:hypothetical protein
VTCAALIDASSRSPPGNSMARLILKIAGLSRMHSIASVCDAAKASLTGCGNAVIRSSVEWRVPNT